MASKGAHTLIVGWEGYGKTHLLRHLSNNGIANSTPCDVMIHFAVPGPPKEFLLTLGEEMVKQGDLKLDVDEKHDAHWVMEKLKVRQLHRIVHDSLAKSHNRYLLLIDDIDQISPTQKAMMQEVLELRNVQVIATAKSQRPRLASLWHHFFTVGLSRLPKAVSDRIVEEFLEERGIPVADDWRMKGAKREGEGLKVLKERLYRKSRGNPRNLKALLRKIEIEGYVDRDYMMKELGAEAEEPYIDMTWFIIATA
ncbi:MAG: AAA family ATPase, partial [Candidatus Bipolaricaulia bacterium]